jgi:Na+/proline symporter
MEDIDNSQFDMIKWAQLDPKKLSRDVKVHLNEVCTKMSTFQGVLMEIVMIVFIVHHMAIIYNAERAMDLASASDECSQAQISKVNTACQALVLYGRIGVALCVLMLVFSRYLDSMGPNAVDYANMFLGVASIMLFALNLIQTKAVHDQAAACTGAAGSGNHTQALPEMKKAADNLNAWSGIGLGASILYTGFFAYQKFAVHVKKALAK